MQEILRYTSEYKTRWDEFINSARNGTFMFLRNYMDYHADRFNDCSFLILNQGKVEAVLPGNCRDNCFFSHEGLTFGGLVLSDKITANKTVDIFNLLLEELKKIEISEVVYKPLPLIYHRIPAQEDIYALFLQKATKSGCNISSVIYQNNKLRFSELRRRCIQKSLRENIQVCESNDFSPFWKILVSNLAQKFNVKPVHTLPEIELLKSRFPENIKLYTAHKEGVMIGGVVLYIMNQVVKVQYISADEKGKKAGALDLLFYKLIHEIYPDIPIFDFGISTEKMGNYLNKNLIFQKEGFGGRGVVYEIYDFKI